MEKLRKISRVGILATIIFAVMTLILAALISYTSLGEKWSYLGMFLIVTLVCIATGYMVGRMFKSKGIYVGIITSIFTVELLIIAVQLVTLGGITKIVPDIFYLISVLFGTVGAIVGVNSNK